MWIYRDRAPRAPRRAPRERTDFHQFSKNWMAELLNETFYLEAMSYLRTKYEAVTFLVVSDDQEWYRHHLQAEDVIVMTGHSPAVDLAIMAQCQAAIVDYGTFSVWGGILCRGEVLVTSKETILAGLIFSFSILVGRKYFKQNKTSSCCVACFIA